MNIIHTILLLIVVLPFIAYSCSGHEQGSSLAVNTYCPVMGDMKIDSQVFTDYNGKRIYFCCANCSSVFEDNPEKYLTSLPQFEGSNDRENAREYGGRHFSFTSLIEPFGVTTLSLLILTGVTGIFRRKLPGALVKWHKRFGVITVVFASMHATLVLILF